MMFSMVGRLDECLLVALRTPASAVSHLIPDGLRLMTRGQWAFWNVVLCRVARMRPAGTPSLFGISYHHVAYRLYVTARTRERGEISGLFFVRSDANSRAISRPGNWVSDFRFHQSWVSSHVSDGELRMSVRTTESRFDADVTSVCDESGLELEPGSCFSSIAEARTVLKYQPLGLSVQRDGRSVKLAEVVRDEKDWNERQARLVEHRFAAFAGIGVPSPQLELATVVAPIPYRWTLGRRLTLER